MPVCEVDLRVGGKWRFVNGRTRMTATVEYPSREIRDIVMNSGMDKGAAISYDRLEELAMALAAAR